MTLRDQIAEQALTLPTADRAFLANLLEKSLTESGAELPSEAWNAEENPGMSSQEFHAELQRRSAAYQSGSTTARSASEVLADLNSRQSGELSK